MIRDREGHANPPVVGRSPIRDLLDSAGRVLERSVGLRLDPAQRLRLEHWLRTTAEERRVDSAEIVDELTAEGPALQSALDELTVQETSFFRDPAQFEALRTHVLPTLTQPVTIWSAGCAWGHEPYSLAMTLATSDVAEWRVLASDISSRALRQAQSGRYREKQLAGLTEEHRARFLRRVSDGWEVVPELRERVTVFRHNVVKELPPASVVGSQVVFCRNVLIYFNRNDLLIALDRLAQSLHPEGTLFLGYSESLWQVSDRFRLVRLDAAFAYRHPKAAVRPAAALRRAPGGVASARPATAAPAPPRPRADRPPPAAAVGVPLVGALLAEGEAALETGDVIGGVAALRKAVYLDPDNAIAHFQLGLAFELAREPGQALRAFNAARAALGRSGSAAAAEAALEGYRPSELMRLLDTRIARQRPESRG